MRGQQNIKTSTLYNSRVLIRMSVCLSLSLSLSLSLTHTHTHTHTHTNPWLMGQRLMTNISHSLSLLIHNNEVALTCKPVRCYTSHQKHSQIWNADSLRTLWDPLWVWAHEQPSGPCWAPRSHPLPSWPILQHITNRRPDEWPRISWGCNSGWLDWQPHKAIQVNQHFEGQLYIYRDGKSQFMNCTLYSKYLTWLSVQEDFFDLP